MATAYSTLLGLALPVQGELSGTWGDTVDNGITRYVDIAVAGTVTLTNDGAVTMSLTNGDASATNIVSSLTGAGTVSAQFAIIKVTGTLTTAKVLTPPSSSRTYVVVNAATGSTVTVKASGQTGVSIAVGETAFVYFNGTDYVKVAGTVDTGVTSFQTSLSGLTPSTSTTGAVTLAGTLGTANGGTNLGGATPFTSGGVVYASSSSALATGSALTWSGTSLLVNGSARFGSSAVLPGFAGANDVSLANNAALRGTNSTGVTAFELIKFNTSDQVVINNDGADAVLTNATIFHRWSIGGEQMRLTSTGLGIGTSSPAYKLDITSASDASLLQVKSTANANNTAMRFGIDGNNSFINATGGSTGALQLRTYGTTQATLDASGNLGLGVTPSAWSLGRNIELGYAGNALFSVGTQQFNMTANAYYNAGYKYGSTGGASYYQQSAGVHAWFNAASGTAGNAISFTQAMTLDAGGDLCLGTTESNRRLNVYETNATANSSTAFWNLDYAGIYLRNESNTANTLTGIGFGGGSSGYSCSGIANILESTTLGALGFFTGGQGRSNTVPERARISSAGGFSVGTTADPGAGAIYATGNITAYYSDARLKTVSGKIENALDKVAQLSGVYYTNNSVAKSFGYDSDEVQVGVLAQDVEAVLPQVVKAAPFDLDADGNSKSGENYKTVQYERLVSLLIEAINELQAKVKALEAK